jgi:hypothetical protein
MLRALAALAVAGCFHPNIPSGVACADSDHCPVGQTCRNGFCESGDAAPPDTQDAFLCPWVPHHFVSCAIPPPGPDITLTKDATPYELDTDAVTLLDKNKAPIAITTMVIDQSGTPALVISTGSLSIETGATLRAIGMRPVIVAAFHTITIAGTLDVASRRAVGLGAGANPAECMANAATAGQDGTGGAGGGGGGAFQGAGGSGGGGDSNGTPKTGGTGGTMVAVPHVVRGGCGGANGGKGSGANSLGAAGGGAIQLTAHDALTISGTIDAGGAGAPPGTNTDGGGAGGGAGGYIGLESATLTLTGATFAANGGGGGGGDGPLGVSNPGADATATTTAAAGGGATSCATAGGAGSAGATLDGTSKTVVPQCGGGGGGGAAGYILVWGTADPSTVAVASPAIIDDPF